jgi:hypothetical protein
MEGFRSTWFPDIYVPPEKQEPMGLMKKKGRGWELDKASPVTPLPAYETTLLPPLSVGARW